MRRIAVSPKAMSLCALALALAPATAAFAQQGQSRDCDAGVAARQLKGQPMTDFLAACRAGRVSPENLGKICAAEADQDKLSGDARRSFVQDCTKGPA